MKLSSELSELHPVDTTESESDLDSQSYTTRILGHIYSDSDISLPSQII